MGLRGWYGSGVEGVVAGRRWGRRGLVRYFFNAF